MTKKHWLIHFTVIGVFALVGGFLAELAFRSGLVQAQSNASTVFSYTMDGQPAQVFYGEDGQIRLQMGTYNAAGERGLPLVGLSDNHGHLRMLLRLAGSNESPILIMKDKAGHDRLLMGLGLSDKTEEPFLSIVDAKGKKTQLFGND